jgi:hypothetical protein
MKEPLRTHQFAPRLVPQHLAASSMKDIDIAMDNSRSIAMAFKNEYVPPLEQETSEFFKKARETLRTGYTNYDRWTVDREREMVLIHEGSGREIESANHDLWAYVDHKGHYVFSTERLSQARVSPEEVAITYRLNGFWGGERYSTPDPASLAWIKEAMREYGRWHLFDPEAFKRSQLALIDGRTGKEI